MNPFTPGAGRKPPYLAGRDDILSSLKRDMHQVCQEAEGTRPVVVSGLRGMGKTVFLRNLLDDAKQEGWMVVWAEASRDEVLSKRITRGIYNELRIHASLRDTLGETFRRALSVFKSFQLKVDPMGAYTFKVDIEPEKGFADSGDLAMDLADLFKAIGEAARDEGTAFFLGIDELQEAPEEDLRALNMALHEIGQEASPVPLFFVGVGLPTLPSVLAKASSYAERMYRYYSLDALDEDSARRALTEPVLKHGWIWDDDALQAVIDVAEGYPFFIQQCGFSICEERVDAGPIDTLLAEIGIERALEEFDRGIYRSRWDRTTPRGRDFMIAMSEDSTMSLLSEVATRMGKRSQSDVSVLRDTLMKSGLIYVPDRGYVAFTIPGMKGFIERHKLD